MTEFSNGGEDSIESRIVGASADAYLVAAVADLFFGDNRRAPRYDAEEVLEVIRTKYSLTDKEVRRAMDLCEEAMLMGLVGIPDESNRAEFEQIVKGGSLDTELAAVDPRIERIAGIIAYGKEHDVDESEAILTEVSHEYGLNKLQLAIVLNAAVAKYDDEVSDARRAGELSE